MARSSIQVVTMNQIPNTEPASQKTKMPFQANGPDLKKGSKLPGMKPTATQKLKKLNHRGNIGVDPLSLKIANAMIRHCMNAGGQGRTAMIQAKSFIK